MANIQIIVGSMLGGTEYVAEACQEILERNGHQVSLHLTPNFSEIPHKDQFWLVCTSTHGAGDYPDNIQAFAQALEQSKQVTEETSFAVIGVGDSSYDTFCQAAKNIENLLLSKGYNKKIDLLTLDMLQEIDPEEEAQQWIIHNKDQLS